MRVKEIYNRYIEQFKIMIKKLKNKKTRRQQIPNLLTASRLCAPIFILPFAFTGHLKLALISTILFAATDGLDGMLARKWHATSEFGRDLDAITDKIFAGTILLALSGYGLCCYPQVFSDRIW